MRVTPFAESGQHAVIGHDGVTGRDLQIIDPDRRFLVAIAFYSPGATSNALETTLDLSYVVLEGTLESTVDGVTRTMGLLDSVWLPRGTMRSMENRSNEPATLLLIAAAAEVGPNDGPSFTRYADAQHYDPPAHVGVEAVTLQDGKAGGPRLRVAQPTYAPGATAAESTTPCDMVAVVLEGEIVVESEGTKHTLGRYDSVWMPPGTVRSLENTSDAPAKLIVIANSPE